MPRTESENKKTTTFNMRVDITATIILENHQKWLKSGKKNSAELLKRIREEFNVSARQAYKYIEEARKQIRQLLIKRRDKKLDKAILDREWVVRKAKDDNDTKLALDAMKDRDKLNELYIENIKHSGEIDLKDINIKSLTDDQLKKLKEMIKGGIPVKDALLHIGVIIK